MGFKNYKGTDYRGIKVEDYKGDNCFAKGTLNLTEQAAVTQTNPKLAEFLKKAAGIKLNFPDYEGCNPYMVKTLSKKEQRKLETTQPGLAKLLRAQAEGSRINRTPGGSYYEVIE
jgi:hypothetical protein